MASKFERLAKDTVVFSFGSIGSKLILFLLVPIYTNYLTTEAYGVGELILTYGQLLLPIISCMVYDAVLRFGTSDLERKEDVAYAGMLLCGASAVLSFALLPAFCSIPSVGGWGIFLSAYLVASTLYQLCINYLKAKDHNMAFAAVGVITTAANAVSTIILVVVLGQGVLGYVASSIIGVTVGSVVALSWSSILKDCRKGRFDMLLWKRMLAYSLPLIFSSVAWWVINSSDRLMIEGMVGSGDLGLYAAAAKIPSLVNVIVAIFSQAWGLSSIREAEAGADSTFSSSVFRFYSVTTFGVAIVAIIAVKQFMRLYVGPEFYASWRYTPLLLSGAVFYALATYYASIYSAIKKTVNGMVTTVVCAAVNIILNYFGIIQFGIWGAVLGTVCAYALLVVVRMIDMNRYMAISIDLRKLALNTVDMLILAIFVSLEQNVWLVTIACPLIFLFINRTELVAIGKKAKSITKLLRNNT